MTDDLLRECQEVLVRANCRIEELEQAMSDIFDHECRTNSKSLIACTAREVLWPSRLDRLEKKDD